jgi:uncharacterized protein (TIRG00374 family)
VLLLLVGVSLYLLLPSLLAVFGSWRSLSHLDWPFAILALACEVTSWVCLWAVDRIALHTRAWFPVAAAQLTGTAVGRILPGGGATATATATAMLRRAGVAEPDEAVAAFGVAAVLQMATTFALPVLALPAMLGGAAINHSLETAAYLGIAMFVALVVAGVAAFASDAPLNVVGRAIQSLLNATVRRHRPVTGLPQRLLGDRDSVRAAVGAQWKTVVWAAAGNTAFDYFALLAAVRAVGADPHPSLVLLAYTAAELLALVPFTPGGLGFVEAGLVGALTLAGVPSGDALAATLLYRIVAYWLPLPAGGAAYLLFRHRYDARNPAT